MFVLEWSTRFIEYIAELVATSNTWVVRNDGVPLFNFASLIVALGVIGVLIRVLFPKN